MKIKNPTFFIWSVISVVFLLVSFIFIDRGYAHTSGDSALHYLISRYAPQHPELFFDHWGKPVFTLLSCGFSQFGFEGIMAFNVLCTLATLWISFLLARKFQLGPSWLVSLLILFMPGYFTLIYSGFTEPLFATILSWAILLTVRRQYLWSSILVSFLPFMRSEGLLFLGLFALFFLWRRQWKYIPGLLLGSLIYGILGSGYHDGDVLWVFQRIPYAIIDPVYGSGSWTYYVDQLFVFMCIFPFVLMILGNVRSIILGAKQRINLEFGVLVFLGFWVFYIAHTIFWHFGIFGSMGLPRVFAAIVSLMALLALNGADGLLVRVPRSRRASILATLVAGIVLLPLSGIPSGFHIKRELDAPKKNILSSLLDSMDGISLQKGRVWFFDPEVAYALDLDPWDSTDCIFNPLPDQIHPESGDVVVWDNWFAPVQRGTSLPQMDSMMAYRPYFDIDGMGASPIYRVYYGEPSVEPY